MFLYKAVNEILRSGDSEIFAQMLAHAYKELARPLPGSDKTGITSEYQVTEVGNKKTGSICFKKITKSHYRLQSSS